MTDLSAPWRLADPAVKLGNVPSGRNWLWERVTDPPAEVADHIARGGLKLKEGLADASRVFGEATTVLGAAPDLMLVVAHLVRLIHVLDAENGYDISHSEPLWADRIFVSIPERDDRVGALRLAEGVIHEAMHLHLTIWEGRCALVADATGETFSPWRQTQRPYGGVLHGLFVFVCLSAFFTQCRETDAAAAGHVRLRLAEIAAELATIDLNALKAGLTKAGRQFVKHLLD